MHARAQGGARRKRYAEQERRNQEGGWMKGMQVAWMKEVVVMHDGGNGTYIQR
jgi:hypothetical protein